MRDRRLAELAGASLASLFSYAFAFMAQPAVAGNESLATILTNSTMRTALAIVLFLTGLLTIMLASCMFKEVTFERR